MLAGAMVGCYPHLMCQVLRSRFAAVCVRGMRSVLVGEICCKFPCGAGALLYGPFCVVRVLCDGGLA